MAQGAAGAESLESAHKALRARDDLQFVFRDAETRETKPTPDWLTELFDAIGALFSGLAPVLEVLFWGLVVVAVLAVLYLIGRELIGLDFLGGGKAKKKVQPAPTYRPAEATARALLADADALAAQGLFEEAVHVLLLRSVDDMRRWRPGSVEPSATSRDLAILPILPNPARTAYSAMARLVEQSLFGGRPVGREGFEESRRAYADFALPGVWA